MIKNCPTCSNENIKEDYKYCPICGIKLGTAQEVPVQEQLSKCNTKYLVEELSKRDGVEVTIAKPYKDIEIKTNGPAIALIVTD